MIGASDAVNRRRGALAPAGVGAGVRWTPLPKAEAPTEPAGETRGTSTLVITTEGENTLQTRTDLAVEADGYIQGEVEGADIEKYTSHGVSVTRINIITEGAAKVLGKPEGRYITLEGLKLSEQYRDLKEHIELIADELSSLLPDDGALLVAGLGNREITSDALGPKSADRILATRHINGELARSTGLDMLRSVSAVAAGVLGQTGIESSEMIKALVDRLHPGAVIAVDALAARSLSRLGNTVQLCDTGIAPGAGVGNGRMRLDKETVGVPVIAVGVPTVADAETLTLELLGRNIDEEEEKRLDGVICGQRMIVTPRDIDLMIERASRLIGMSINCALQRAVDFDTLVSLVS